MGESLERVGATNYTLSLALSALPADIVTLPQSLPEREGESPSP